MESQDYLVIFGIQNVASFVKGYWDIRIWISEYFARQMVKASGQNYGKKRSGQKIIIS